MAKKAESKSRSPQPGKKAQAKQSPDAAMADILHRAALQQFYTVTSEEMHGLRMEEIRQLHIARLSKLPAPLLLTRPTPASPPPAKEASPTTATQRAPRGKGGRPPYPAHERAIVVAHHKQRAAVDKRHTLKMTARWTAGEASEGRLTRSVSAKTLGEWLREEETAEETPASYFRSRSAASPGYPENRATRAEETGS